MLANYGYSDGSGDYFIIIDTDKCDGCGECAEACPEHVFEVAQDDYGKRAARVREAAASRLSYVCPGVSVCSSNQSTHCHAVCKPQALVHSW